MLRPSPNHGTQRLPNDDDDIHVYIVYYYIYKLRHGKTLYAEWCAVLTLRVPVIRHRPLSRRLDRCDRMIQNEGNDSRKLFTLKIALCR